MTVLENLMNRQRRREVRDAVPDEWKTLVAETGAIFAESKTSRCPWCELHVPMDYQKLPNLVRINEETT